MHNSYFLSLEACEQARDIDLYEAIDQLNFNDQGLIPVVAQDHQTQQVLMLAWMNKDSIKQTLATNDMTYWSRSRQQFWIKGATSGNTQKLVSMSIDCDGDALVCQVKQIGGACHTGRTHCFYLSVDQEKQTLHVPSVNEDV